MKTTRINSNIFINTILLIFISTGIVGCNKIEKDIEKNKGTLTISISTKSVDNDTNTKYQNGDVINSLRIYLLDSQNKVVALENIPNIPSGASNYSCTLRDLMVGVCELYVVANHGNTPSLPNLSKGDICNIANLTSKTIQGGQTPTFTPSDGYPNGMPLTKKVRVPITYGHNVIEVQLERIVAKYSVDVASNIQGYTLEISNLSFSNFQTNKTFYFGDEEHSLPSNVSYISFPQNMIKSGTDNTLSLNERKNISQVYIYDNAAANYSLIIGGSIKNGDAVIKSFSETVPITYLDKYMAPQPLNSIYRNQHIHTIINVFYNDKIGSFSFKVLGWIEKEESVIFN